MAGTPVSYFVVEDEDEEAHPNVFYVQRSVEKMRLGDVRKLFPLPGSYHFRFKSLHGSSQ